MSGTDIAAFVTVTNPCAIMVAISFSPVMAMGLRLFDKEVL